MNAPSTDVTLILKAMNDGDPSAAERLLPLVYAELHRLARGYMRNERQEHTLQPTALINEAYLRLCSQQMDWQNSQHFIGVAATAMRRILVDHARAHNAGIRGGNLQRIDNEGFEFSVEGRSDEILAVDEALERLKTVSPRQAQIVELRYFTGLQMEEIAGLLGIAVRTVKRDWALAKIWLFKELSVSSKKH